MSPGQRRTTGVVDHDVEAPEALDRLAISSRMVSGWSRSPAKTSTSRAGRVANLLRGLIEIGLGAAAHHHLDAFLGQHFRTGPAQALARAADDGHLVFQFEIHRTVLSGRRPGCRSSGGRGADGADSADASGGAEVTRFASECRVYLCSRTPAALFADTAIALSDSTQDPHGEASTIWPTASRRCCFMRKAGDRFGSETAQPST